MKWDGTTKSGKRMQDLHALILRLAGEIKGAGEIEQSVKWGQASFATARPKSGTPIRIDSNTDAGTYSLFVPCSTSLISDFRETHPQIFDYHGNREIRLNLNAPMPKAELSLFITAALTYYLP